jgi:ATP-dependent Clp protease ATP-binding subunit ClpA
MISSELNAVFQKALSFAKDQRHEYLTIEHVFFALLSSNEGIEIIKECGGDAAHLRELLGLYIQEHIMPLPENINAEPYETVALSRLIDQMVRHIQSAQKSQAEVGDLMAAIFEEKHTYSAILLQENEISRVDVLEVISHRNIDENEDSESQSNLLKYTIELVATAKAGKIDPVIGRNNEV